VSRDSVSMLMGESADAAYVASEWCPWSTRGRRRDAGIQGDE
jgi:hypothetical protein